MTTKEAKSIAVYRADALRLEAVIAEKDKEIGDARAVLGLRGIEVDELTEKLKGKDREINALQIAHVNQESDNMVLRKYLKEVYDVLDRYQAFQLSGKTEEERTKETGSKE
jgi:hypothetical protein